MHWAVLAVVCRLLLLLVCYAIRAAVQEANAINKSLTFLEQTVNALSRKEGHIPFRQSKLTHLLKDALGGNCKTVSPDCPCPPASAFPARIFCTLLRLQSRSLLQVTTTDYYYRSLVQCMSTLYSIPCAEYSVTIACT